MIPTMIRATVTESIISPDQKAGGHRDDNILTGGEGQ